MRAGADAVVLAGPKQRAVLAMLALDPGRVVSVDRLVEGIWDEEPPASAAKMVQHYVAQLRAALGVGITRRGRGYELDLAPDAVDAVRFQRLVRAPEAARQALSLWRGPALADLGRCAVRRGGDPPPRGLAACGD